eukprot:gene8082-10949_t
MKRRKKSEKAQSLIEHKSVTYVLLTILLILLLVLYCNPTLLNVVFHGGEGNISSKQDFINNAFSSDQYQQLLLKAQQLSDKYKELTGVKDLPKDLSIHELLSKHSLLNEITSDSSTNLKVPKAIVGLTSAMDLVIGLAQDIDSKNLAVFCQSLRSVTKAEAVIFINLPIPPKHEEIALESKIKLIGYDLRSKDLVSMSSFHPSTLRWVLIYEYLKVEAPRYKRVWMIDVRDSFFQSDPFQFIDSSKPSLNVFNGVESIKIRDCGWNSGWVKDCFGDSTLRRIGANTIICSGVTAGTTDRVLEYVTLMKNIISTGNSGTNNVLLSPITANFPSCERNGVDQGVHNVLIHLSTVSDLRIWSHKDGPVANMQAKVARIISTSYLQKVVNGNGAEVAVVHQYDRFPDLQKYLFEKYVDWIDTNDFLSQWKNEPDCRKYDFKENKDLFKGVCDIKMRGGATGAYSCCKYCNDVDGCQAFTYFSSVCYLKKCSKPITDNALAGAITAYRTS